MKRKNLHFLRRMTAGLLAAAGLLSGISAPLPAAAYEPYRWFAGYAGDLNSDSKLNREDVHLLESYLTGWNNYDYILEIKPAFGRCCDINGDHSVDVIDLSLLKQMVMRGDELTPLYEESHLISPPIAALNPSLSSVGDQHILMVAVDFPDCRFAEGYSAAQIQELAFGAENTESPAYPLESITAYYQRASYGRLNLIGDVYLYTAQNSISSYVKKNNSLLNEVMSALDAEIDYTKYDGDQNGILDSVILALPGTANSKIWWPCSEVYGGYRRFDGIKAGKFCIGAWALSDHSGFNSTWVHELGHVMGLPDYYRYENYENTEEDDYGKGLHGDAGWLMMDDAFGDMSAFDKLMLGWYAEHEVQIYDPNEQSKMFTLKCSQTEPSCVIIPRTDLNGCLSEFFILEYVENIGNNAKAFYEDMPYEMFRRGGIRILHCDAELWNGNWGPEFKWSNYGQCYDNSNEKQRVLRLVENPFTMFFLGGQCDADTEGFAWYDSDGYATVDPELVIRFLQPINDNGLRILTVRHKWEDE